ncbi:hypothetical protein LAZ40_04430 [Cereibacter sphaeroides]|uniref:hypothetical protein n=1 Tax=Cereibacter sphaeroides TaxID=1063 RepID=UPI001F222A4D|nr:hypothetical protein [Cereibacter sphaeroides]MCE6958302.1 hypothetical protein [Cereibacter sphaeroides]MCE6971912.1 hypothetical protein [Cereibacter sphaeroides]
MIHGAIGDIPELMPEFVAKGYKTEIMMRHALRRSGLAVSETCGVGPDYGLVRILWHGLWWDDPKPFARERHSNCIAVTGCETGPVEVFDMNAMAMCGWIKCDEWRDGLVPGCLRKRSRMRLAAGASFIGASARTA